MNIKGLFNNIKSFLKDNSTKQYHLIFNLINNNDISYICNIEEFNKIKEWYENEDSTNYLIQDINIPTSKGKYINLNKKNIVEFSYSSITNREKRLNPIIYILTCTTPKMLNIISYIKCNFILFIVFTLFSTYSKYNFSINIGNILSDTTLILNAFNRTISLVTYIFLIYYIFFFILKIFELYRLDSSEYIYKVKKQVEGRHYHYASINFAFIILFRISLLRIHEIL